MSNTEITTFSFQYLRKQIQKELLALKVHALIHSFSLCLILGKVNISELQFPVN